MSKIMVNDEAGFSFYNIGRGESICCLRGDLLAKPFHYTKTVRETLIQSQGSVSYGFLSIASSSSSVSLGGRSGESFFVRRQADSERIVRNGKPVV